MYSAQCACIVIVIQSTYSNWANLVVKRKNLEEIRLSEYIFVCLSTVSIVRCKIMERKSEKKSVFDGGGGLRE
jgi:hypothetical protein